MSNPYDQLADAWDEGYAVGYRKGNAQGRDDARNEPKTNITRDQVIAWLERERRRLAEYGTTAVESSLLACIEEFVPVLEDPKAWQE